MSKLQVGYSKGIINPPMGIGIGGYFIPRFAKGILDDLEVGVLVLSHGDERVALVSVDACLISKTLVDRYTETVESLTGIPRDNVLISATHTHTAGLLFPTGAFSADTETIAEYASLVGDVIGRCAKEAADDLSDARMGYIFGHAPDRVAYIRRYRMKDGSVMTCPPVDDPNIDHPLGELDGRVNLLRFDRDGKESVALVNYGLHADTIGGELISSDWPGWMRRTLDKALDGVRCIFLNGAEGDVGSTNVHPSGGDMNDTEISFDNEMKSPGMARFIGRAIAGAVLGIWDKAHYVDVDSIGVVKRRVSIGANLPTEDELRVARKYKELHESGRDDLIPYTAMELSTVLGESLRMCRMAGGPESFSFDITGVRIGEVALVGMPGEPFTEIGVRIKDTDGFSMILPCALTGGNEGYFPTSSAYDEGGYETRTSPYRKGVDDTLVKESKSLLSDLRGI